MPVHGGQLAARDLPRGGVVVNQVHYCEAAEHDARSVLGPVVAAEAGDFDDKTVARVLARLGMAHRRLHELAEAERLLRDRVKVATSGADFYQESPRLEDDVCDLPGLREVGGNVFGRPAESM